jgi:hypothetical protein
MSYHHGLNVEKNGLIIYWDAANPKSYSSGSVSCYNLCGPSYQAVLTGSLAFNPTSSRGAWKFGTTGDYLDTTTYSDTDALRYRTTNAWFKQTGTNNGAFSSVACIMSADYNPQTEIRTYSTSATQNTASLVVQTDTTSNLIQSPISRGVWYMGTVVETSAGGDNLLFYINGGLVGVASRSGSTYQYAADKVRVGMQKLTSARTFNGDIAMFMLYNRPLSSVEVASLYDATKGRFS